MRRLGGILLILAAAAACSSRPSNPAAPTPTPTATIRPLPEPVQAKAREVYPILARELALLPNQEERVRTHLDNALARVYQLSTVPIASERGRAQMIKITLDQFETDMLRTLTDEQLPRWEEIKASTRRSMSKIVIAPAAAPTPLPPPRGGY
ncbi:MAG TPA: hypothetical protein VIA29_07780 [Thermoanaerobaculia bacterium]|jgi:hypothetical protein